DDDVLRTNLQPASGAKLLRRGGTQLVDAGRWRVAVLAAFDRDDRRVLHVARRREIRLADAKRNDIASFACERVDFGENDKCVLGAERFGAPRKSRHGQRTWVRRGHLKFL